MKYLTLENAIEQYCEFHESRDCQPYFVQCAQGLIQCLTHNRPLKILYWINWWIREWSMLSQIPDLLSTLWIYKKWDPFSALPMLFCQHWILCWGQLSFPNDMFFTMQWDFRPWNLFPVCTGLGKHNCFPLTQPLWGLPSLCGLGWRRSTSKSFPVVSACGWQRSNANLGKGRAYSCSDSTLQLWASWVITTLPVPLLGKLPGPAYMSFFEKNRAPRKGVKEEGFESAGFRGLRWERMWISSSVVSSSAGVIN